MWCAALLIVLIARTIPSIFGYGTALAVALAAFEYTGGSLWGKGKDQNVDKYEELERLRKNYRTPAEQTIAEIGEGRGMYLHSFMRTTICNLTGRTFNSNSYFSGIYGPGYAERRRERIKETYGIDVPATPPPAS